MNKKIINSFIIIFIIIFIIFIFSTIIYYIIIKDENRYYGIITMEYCGEIGGNLFEQEKGCPQGKREIAEINYHKYNIWTAFICCK